MYICICVCMCIYVFCSRQVALSRIRNVLLKEKQSKQVLDSDKEIRRSRLRTVEIEATMARAHNDARRVSCDVSSDNMSNVSILRQQSARSTSSSNTSTTTTTEAAATDNSYLLNSRSSSSSSSSSYSNSSNGRSMLAATTIATDLSPARLQSYEETSILDPQSTIIDSVQKLAQVK